jgi:hypothetical protein
MLLPKKKSPSNIPSLPRSRHHQPPLPPSSSRQALGTVKEDGTVSHGRQRTCGVIGLGWRHRLSGRVTLAWMTTAALDF